MLQTPVTNLSYFFNLKENINYWAYYVYGKARSYAQPYISTVFSADKITDNIYLGDFESACNKDELSKLGITHVVTVILAVDAMYPQDFKYKTIDICDQTSANIYKYFDDCSDFIDDAIKKGGKVYVHCMYGISRSATIIAAYLISKQGYDDNNAIDFIQKHRPRINPNQGFREQLQLYSEYIQQKLTH